MSIAEEADETPDAQLFWRSPPLSTLAADGGEVAPRVAGTKIETPRTDLERDGAHERKLALRLKNMSSRWTSFEEHIILATASLSTAGVGCPESELSVLCHIAFGGGSAAQKAIEKADVQLSKCRAARHKLVGPAEAVERCALPSEV